MAEILKRIIKSSVPNVFISDLGIFLQRAGDSLNLLAPDIKGRPIRTLQDVCASVDLDNLLRRTNPPITLWDENGQQITGDNIQKSTNLATLLNSGTGTNSGSTSGSSGGSASAITQQNHNFQIGDVIELNGGIYQKAIANNSSNGEVVGIVSSVENSNNFTVALSGSMEGLSGLISGSVYFLSDEIPGLLTIQEPTIAGHVSKPLFIASSETTGFVFNWRGMTIGAVVSNSTGSSTNEIHQANHGFQIGDAIENSGGTHYKALADNASDGEVVGVVSQIVGTDDFIITINGIIQGLSGLVPGSVYFLSDTVPGLLTLTETSTAGSISKPMMVAFGTESAYLFNWRGIIVGAGNISPSNNLFTPIYKTTANNNDVLPVNSLVFSNTLGGPFELFLPTNPSTGNILEILDASYSCATHNLTIGGSGRKINGVLEDLILDVDKIHIKLIYNSIFDNWDIAFLA